jgi:acyl-CoA synthetase (AMP-forming)/AMP-acid ligase II
LGQEVLAVVVPLPGEQLDTGELAGFVRRRLAGFKVPAHWRVEERPLPRTASGKVMKSAIPTEPAGRIQSPP